MKTVNSILVTCLMLISVIMYGQNSYYNPEIPDLVTYKVTPDVRYGEAKVLKDGEVLSKSLTMDVYYPANEAEGDRPAIILSYGGSFHRGNPRIPYNGFGGQTTSMSQYAQRYAAEGFVVFTINYRVATDNPVIDAYEGYTAEDLDTRIFNSPEAISQINVIRKQMNLDELTADNVEDVMKNAVLAASEDLRTAIRHIKAEYDHYKIDTDRIALGGFSAGAVSSINVAYGMQEEVAAVFTNSGFPSLFKMEQLLDETKDYPPLLIFMSENDYPIVTSLMPPFMQLLNQKGVEYYFNWVPGFGHFYPGGAVSLSTQGDKMPLIERTVNYLKESLVLE
ncbi:MAG: dienelactone hydrolase family protein [Carboxylicivirga sp.]|nr:dienelactone hydrolase family protein [Carboxylicivirga sp.]